MYKVLLADVLEDVGIRILEQECQVTKEFEIDKAGLLEIIADYDAVMVRGNTHIDKEIIDKGVNLKVIAAPGSGLDHIDVNYAKQKNIDVYNLPGENVTSVAELTFAHIINIARNVYPAVKKTKQEGSWDKFPFVGRELSGKVLGVIGLGRIGLRVAEIANAFRMEVIAYDPYVSQNVLPENIQLVSLDNLLGTADIITVHVPLSKETYHLISFDEIAKMKQGAYIINMSRGEILDEDAIYEGLVSGKLAGAGSDVMENEPPPGQKIKPSKLFALDNYLITPHLGAWTVEAQNRVAEKVAKTIINGLKKRSVGEQ